MICILDRCLFIHACTTITMPLLVPIKFNTVTPVERLFILSSLVLRRNRLFDRQLESLLHMSYNYWLSDKQVR